MDIHRKTNPDQSPTGVRFGFVLFGSILDNGFEQIQFLTALNIHIF